MRFVPHLHSSVQAQIRTLAETLKSTKDQPKLTEREKADISERLNFFQHTTSRDQIDIASVAANGDFPATTYADTYIYATFAQAVVYKADSVSGLREIHASQEPIFNFALFSEDDAARYESFDKAFTALSSAPIKEIIEASDYQHLKSRESRKPVSPTPLMRGLIRPKAADAGNIGIQLRSTAELGMALRILQSEAKLDYLLIEGTLSLPMVAQVEVSLFYEHLKRFCCLTASKKQIGFMALTRSHGISQSQLLEEIVREKALRESDRTAEHWFLRLSIPSVDKWETSLTKGRRLPPVGAVTYLFRLHRTTPLMRLDVDLNYWRETIQGASERQTRNNEQKLFEDLDYTSHDQRSYGIPYPLYSVNQRVVLTKAERIALRQQIIDAAVKAGMKRSLFREPSIYTSSNQE